MSLVKSRPCPCTTETSRRRILSPSPDPRLLSSRLARPTRPTNWASDVFTLQADPLSTRRARLKMSCGTTTALPRSSIGTSKTPRAEIQSSRFARPSTSPTARRTNCYSAPCSNISTRGQKPKLRSKSAFIGSGMMGIARIALTQEVQWRLKSVTARPKTAVITSLGVIQVRSLILSLILISLSPRLQLRRCLVLVALC